MEKSKLTKKGIRVTNRDIAKLLVKALPLPDHSPTSNLDWGLWSLGYRNKPLLARLRKETFRTKVAEYEAVIAKLSPQNQKALATAYVFSSKVPKEEREDFYQELALTLIENGSADDRLLYTIARRDWVNWWEKYQIRSHFFGGYLSQFEQVETASDGNVLDLAKQEYMELLKKANWDNATLEKLESRYDTYQQRKARKDAKRQERIAKRELTDCLIGALDFETQIIGNLDALRLWRMLGSELRSIVAKRYEGKPLTAAERQRLHRFAKAHTGWLVPES